MLGLALFSLAVRSLPGLIARPAAARLMRMSSVPSPGPTIGSPEHHIRDYTDLSGADLFRMSAQFGGCLGSSRERLAREIMIVDNVSHEDALEVVRGMARENAEGLTSVWPTASGLLPSVSTQLFVKYQQLGISTAFIAAWVSIPAVFSLPFAKAFNDLTVTTIVPPASDLDTMLEVGIWTWKWMEPPLGTISFFLLCIQFARDQKVNIRGGKPWTTYWKEKQGDKLAAAYPQYHKPIVRDYGQETCFEDDSDNF
eukprot:scaffold35899_cov66-Phaeocystis_antarctica.AAC.2